METHYTYHDSPLGRLLLVGTDEQLTAISFSAGTTQQQPDADWLRSSTPFLEAGRQLDAYFARELTEFNLTVCPHGTDFQRQVWRELQRIPYGKTCAYSDVAQAINRPAACRAVGAANHMNPIPIVIPCHRVIGKNGELVGFGGGLPLKQQLLVLEGAECTQIPVQQTLF